MPIYEYYCAGCDAEFELLRAASRAEEPAPCKTCGAPGERQLSTFSFKSNTFSAPRLKRPQTPLRSHSRGPERETTSDSE